MVRFTIWAKLRAKTSKKGTELSDIIGFKPNTTQSQSALNYLNRDSLRPVVPVVVGPVAEVDCVVVDPAVVIGPVLEVECVVVDPAVFSVVAGGKQVTESYKFIATLIKDN